MDYPRNHDSHLRQRQLQANALVPAHVEGLETSHVVLLGPVGGQETLREEGVGQVEVVGLAVAGELVVGDVGLCRCS